MKVFLDGTREDSNWRKELIPLLKLDYYVPKTDGWNIDDEEEERNKCDIHLYVITPKMRGFHLISQLMESAFNTSRVFCNPRYTVFCLLYEDEDAAFSRQQIRSLNLVRDMFKKHNNCIVCNDLKNVADLLNTLNN